MIGLLLPSAPPARDRVFLGATFTASLLALVTACGGDDEVRVFGNQPLGNEGGAAGGEATGRAGDSSAAPQGGSGGGSSGGAPSNGNDGSVDNGTPSSEQTPGGVVEVNGSIVSDTTWSAASPIVLTGVVYVEDGATLTIEPGATIRGGGLGSALVITRGSRLVAEGTAEAPIVFTSNIAPGLRAAGDWGGVVLLGSAPINAATGEEQIEGVDATENRGTYGGDDPEHDCGSLRYVRIEFAGFEIGPDNELNGLTVGGCGSRTRLEYLQVHRGLDDGIEFFGGTASVKRAVLTNIDDDSVDWDLGWTGRAQFVVIRHDPVHSDSAFEADNGPTAEVFESEPRSAPTLYNLTLVGDPASTSPGLVLRRGTWGVIRNAIVQGFPLGAVDVRDAASVAGTALEPPALSVENSLFFQNGAGGGVHFGATGTGALEPTDGSGDDDDAGFDEAAFFTDAARANRIDADPGLADPAHVTAPSFAPAADGPAASGFAAVPDDGFFEAAEFIGAVPPTGDDWTAGWTAYPEN